MLYKKNTHRFNADSVGGKGCTAINPPSQILHFAGLLSDEAYSFIKPTLRELHSRGLSQVVILPKQSRALELIEEFGGQVKFVFPHTLKRGGSIHWPMMSRCLQEWIGSHPPNVLHMHGYKAWIVGIRAAARTDRDIRLVYSTHGSRSLNSLDLLGKLGAALLTDRRLRRKCILVASAAHEVEHVQRVHGRKALFADSTVDPLFFSITPTPALNITIVAGGSSHDELGFRLFVRLAVKLRGVVDELRLVWIGGGNEQAIALLKAAQIEVIEPHQGPAFVRTMSSSWLYLQTTQMAGFPVFIAQAMAAGLPCLAPDTPYHREIVEHGRTGLLFSGEAELIRSIGLLYQNTSLRQRLGKAGRLAAQARFRPEIFNLLLEQIYALTPQTYALTAIEEIACPQNKKRQA